MRPFSITTSAPSMTLSPSHNFPKRTAVILCAEAHKVSSSTTMTNKIRHFITSRMLLIGWRIAGRERLFRRFVDECVLVGVNNFLFRLQPVVELRAKLIAALHVEFLGSLPDTFFEWKRLDQWFLCRNRQSHGECLWRRR